nr:hypothetical protein [Tanacetum cinerariifolium]
MDRGFLSQKGSRVGRGVKEKLVSTGVKLVNRTKSNTDAGTGLITKSDETLNDANPLKEVVSPSVIDEHVAMEVQSPLVAQTYSVQSHVVEENVAVECPVVNTPDVGPYLPLLTHEANSAANAPGKPSYATATGKPNRKKVNVRTLFTPGGNGIDVVVPVESIHAISARFDNTAYGFFFGKKVAYLVVANYEDVSTVPFWVKPYGIPVTAFSKDGLSSIATKLGTPLMLDSYTSDMCMKSWGRLSYARVMIELRADVELKDNIVMAMPKITKEGHYTCNVWVEYEWKPPRCLSRKVFGHIHEECSKNIGAGEKKTVKKLSQTSQGVLVDPKIGKLRLLDNDGNPLVPTGIVESDSVVEVIFDDTANLRISTSGKYRSEKGYGTNSLLEQ